MNKQYELNGAKFKVVKDITCNLSVRGVTLYDVYKRPSSDKLTAFYAWSSWADRMNREYCHNGNSYIYSMYISSATGWFYTLVFSGVVIDIVEQHHNCTIRRVRHFVACATGRNNYIKFTKEYTEAI